MQRTVFVVVLAACLVAMAEPRRRPNVANLSSEQVTKLLQDSGLVKREVDCVLKKGPCDKFGEEIVRLVPKVVLDKCKECSPSQAANVRKLKDFLEKSHPGVWDQVEKIYGKH